MERFDATSYELYYASLCGIEIPTGRSKRKKKQTGRTIWKKVIILLKTTTSSDAQRDLTSDNMTWTIKNLHRYQKE